MLRAMEEPRPGLVVRALRRQRGWRQLDLARVAGVSQSTVSDVERGHLDTLSIRAITSVSVALERGSFTRFVGESVTSTGCWMRTTRR